MKKRVLSVLLSLCMLFSLLPTTALADQSDIVTAESYQELVECLNNDAAETIIIAGTYRDPLTGSKLSFDWGTGTTLDLVSAKDEIHVSGRWDIPSNVTANVGEQVFLSYESPSIHVYGNWNITDTYASVHAPNFGASRTLTIENGGKATLSPAFYSNSAAPVSGVANFVLNGTLDLNGNVGLVNTWVLGAGAVVTSTKTPATGNEALLLQNGASLSGADGVAVNFPIQGVQNQGTATLSGDLVLSRLNLTQGGSLTIAAGSHVTVKYLYAANTANAVLTVDGTLELDADLGESPLFTHCFQDGAIMTINQNGVLKLNPGNYLDTGEVSATVNGEGTIKLYALYNGTTDTYNTKAAVFGSIASTPSQVADSIGIWRCWEDCSHVWGEETAPCTLCGTEKQAGESGGSGEEGGNSGEEGGSGNEGGTGSEGSGGNTGTTLHKLSTPTNLHWGTFYTNQVTGDGFSYPGMISWKVADPAYDQELELSLYKDGEWQYTTEWDYYADAENPRVYRCDWDFSLSELDRGSGAYTFTIQARGDGTTTSDSDVVTSPVWNYTRRTDYLTAPEIIGWSGASARWNEVAGEHVGGYVVDFYYSADNASATSTDDLRRVAGFVKYNGEEGDPLTSYEPMASWLERYGSGYYYFTARTVSSDVTAICHSEPSGLSGAYHYTGSAGGEEPCNHSGGTATCTQQAVCGTCGKAYGELADHEWKTTWTTNGTQHWHQCANCDAKKDAANHTPDGVTDCTVESKCTACEAVLRAAGSHTPVTDPYVAPTLTSTGLTEGSHCGTCNATILAQEIIPTLKCQMVYFLPDFYTWTYGDEEIKNGFYAYAYNDSVLDGQLTYRSENPAVATVAANGKVTIVGAGTAVITATAPAVKDQYAETTARCTLTVNKAPLTVTAKDKTIAYGAAPANDGYTVSGLVNGETESVLTSTAAYTYNYQQYGKAGPYTITPSGLSAKNYAITFVPGTLTVEKAAAHTITLGNLTQNVGSVSAVTATVAPQDSTATIQVEYETVTAAKPCGHQHDTACGENGATCTHTDHDEACGYAAETRTWGTTVPTVKGTYNVRASLTASDNIVIPAEPVYTTGTLEIKAQATIGGGSSSSSGSGKNDSLDVNSGGNSVAVDVKVENGSAEVIVTEKNLKEILDNVPASGEMVVDLTSVNGAEELVLPAKLVEALSESSETKELTVVSEAAEITMGADVMETLAETLTGTNDKVSVELTAVDKKDLTRAQQKALNSIAVDAVVVELTMMVSHYNDKGTATGQTQLHELGGKVDVRVAYELPKNMTGKHVVVSYVSDNGTVTYLRANYVDGYVCFTTDHFSTYAVFTNYAASFQDIDLNGWYAADVDYMAANGLMQGNTATTFNPYGTTTRGMIVTILYRLDGSPAVSGEVPFTDVTADQYWAEAVKWAAANGIVGGYGNGKFGPSNAITREQMAAILYRYAQYKGCDVSVGKDTNILSYEDAFRVNEYAIPAMQWACGAGIIRGNAGNLLPAGSATRCQVAAILHRFCESMKQ